MNIWGRLGISVAIVAMFSIVTIEMLQSKAFYQVYRWAICAALLAMGTFLLLVGTFVNANIRASRRDDPEGPRGPFLLVDLQYWGVMLAIFGIIVIFIVPYQKVAAREPKAAAAKEKVVKKVVPMTVTNEPPKLVPVPAKPRPVVFSDLKLQGLVYRGEDSSALINGRTYFVGDIIAGAKLISISETNAVVERDGEQKELLLPQ